MKVIHRMLAAMAALSSSTILVYASSNVTLTDNGNGTATMANGLVSMTFSESGGDVSSFTTAANPNINLIDTSQDYSLSLSHIGSGTNDYWVWIGSSATPTYTVVTNTGQIVDIKIENPKASGAGSLNLYPNGLWDWSIHHVMRAGEAGFYTYHVWNHTASQPAAYYDADSWQGRASSFFVVTSNANGVISNAWAYSSSDVPPCLSFGGGVASPGTDNDPPEDSELVRTNFWTRPAGTNYEPGWPAYTQPTGLTSDLYPIWSKYDYSSYQGASNSFRPVWGVATDQIGLWSILASFEHMNGGPTKQKGAMSGNYMYNDDFEGHGLGDIPNPGAPANQAFTKMIGPFFMYANTGTSHEALWQDAQNEAAIMVSNWPYAWVNETEQVYPRQRGTVTGAITAQTGESTANAVVILCNETNLDWIYQGVTNYMFWTTADSYGNFTIPKVRPGTYQLFSYVPGIWGELQISNVVVTANQTTGLGVISWNPPHLQQRLWRVGTPDHSSGEFHLGNYPKQFALWWRYFNDMGTNNLNFTIGQSVESNNWYYAQPVLGITPQSGASKLTDHTQTSGIYWSPQWNVIFNLTNLPTTNVLLTVALAGSYGTSFYTFINGVNQTPNISGYSSSYSGVGTTTGDDIYRDVVKVGRYQYYQFSFPASDFVVGTNTFGITLRQPGLPGTWSNSTTNAYPDLIAGGLIYDFIQMETGPQVTSTSSFPGAYELKNVKSGLALNVTSAATTNGAPIIQWPYNGSANSLWSFVPTSNGYYQIVNQNSGKDVVVLNEATTNGAPIIQSSFGTTGDDQWEPVLNSDGSYTLYNLHSGMVLDDPGASTASGTQMDQWPANGGSNQHWQLIAQ